MDWSALRKGGLPRYSLLVTKDNLSYYTEHGLTVVTVAHTMNCWEQNALVYHLANAQPDEKIFPIFLFDQDQKSGKDLVAPQ